MVPTKASPQTRTEARAEVRADARDDARIDYEQLRRHLGRPPLEHPAGRQRAAAAPAIPPRQAAAPGADARRSMTAPDVAASSGPSSGLSVMDWLLAIGHVVARRVRGVPRSPMVRLHPRK
jgi:hypothetical protein